MDRHLRRDLRDGAVPVCRRGRGAQRDGAAPARRGADEPRAPDTATPSGRHVGRAAGAWGPDERTRHRELARGPDPGGRSGDRRHLPRELRSGRVLRGGRAPPLHRRLEHGRGARERPPLRRDEAPARRERASGVRARDRERDRGRALAAARVRRDHRPRRRTPRLDAPDTGHVHRALRPRVGARQLPVLYRRWGPCPRRTVPSRHGADVKGARVRASAPVRHRRGPGGRRRHPPRLHRRRTRDRHRELARRADHGRRRRDRRGDDLGPTPGPLQRSR